MGFWFVGWPHVRAKQFKWCHMENWMSQPGVALRPWGPRPCGCFQCYWKLPAHDPDCISLWIAQPPTFPSSWVQVKNSGAFTKHFPCALLDYNFSVLVTKGSWSLVLSNSPVYQTWTGLISLISTMWGPTAPFATWGGGPGFVALWTHLGSTSLKSLHSRRKWPSGLSFIWNF